MNFSDDRDLLLLWFLLSRQRRPMSVRSDSANAARRRPNYEQVTMPDLPLAPVTPAEADDDSSNAFVSPAPPVETTAYEWVDEALPPSPNPPEQSDDAVAAEDDTIQ